MIVWFAQRWLIVVAAVVCSVFVVYGGASTAAKMVAVVLCAGAITLWNLARNLRVHTTINRYAALGQPGPMLELVERELATKVSAQSRLPFCIYKATALSLTGEWESALLLLESIDPRKVGGSAGRTWRFLHATRRVECLLALGRLDDARTALKEELEPFASVVSSPATEVILNETLAKLAFFEARHDDSRALFAALLDDARIVPASQAVYHYFLGRIALETGGDPGESFKLARELAPETFIPGAIDALEQSPGSEPRDTSPVDA